MSVTLAPPLDLAAIISRADYWRRSPASAGGAAGHKEWSYFCLLGHELQMVVAFSIMDSSAEGSAAPAVEIPRVAILAHAPDRWTAIVESCPSSEPSLTAGRIDARFGGQSLAFTRGAYRIDLASDAPRMRASLLLRPVARPGLTRSIPLGGVTPMQWFVVPRLEADGDVWLGQHHYRLDRSPAYHDHNWGSFAWGGDFAWEWGIVLSAGSPAWSLIYYRITDRGRHHVVSQGLLVWRGDRHCRSFRDGALDVRSRGRFRTAGCTRVPGIMRAALNGEAADLPAHLEVSAHAGSDRLELRFELQSCAQIGVPNDGDDGVTCISECPSVAVVDGIVGGEQVQFTSHALIEFNRGAA